MLSLITALSSVSVVTRFGIEGVFFLLDGIFLLFFVFFYTWRHPASCDRHRHHLYRFEPIL